MTRKDYQLIARCISQSLDNYHLLPNAGATLLDAADNLAIALQADNPAFNRNLFLHACGFKASGDSRKLVWSVDHAR